MLTSFRAVFLLAFCLTAALLGCTAAQADSVIDKSAEKIKVAIITGQNNHGWTLDTPVLKNILDEAGLFDTTLLISPDAKDPDKAAKWQQFKPAFSDYSVVIINYNGEMWPDHIKTGFVDYIKGGGKAYVFHAGNNPFNGWTEYEQMVGLLWRKNNEGKRLYFDENGQQKIVQPGDGPGAGHGAKHAYVVKNLDPEHPVFTGLPTEWMHAQDELYHGQRGPAENMTILATAYSDPATKGTGVSEPLVWTIPFGEGLVLTNVMGHWWKNDATGPALQCAGFQTILTRSIEWLATGKVTQEKPADFPGKDAASLRELKPFKPLAYLYVPDFAPFASASVSRQEMEHAEH